MSLISCSVNCQVFHDAGRGGSSVWHVCSKGQIHCLLLSGQLLSKQLLSGQLLSSCLFKLELPLSFRKDSETLILPWADTTFLMLQVARCCM